jgi:hypothetical protein
MKSESPPPKKNLVVVVAKAHLNRAQDPSMGCDDNDDDDNDAFLDSGIYYYHW